MTISRTEKAYHRRQRRLRGPSWGWATVVPIVILLLAVVVLAGCQRGDTWVDGNGHQWVVVDKGILLEFEGTHVDDDPISAGDKTCRLIGNCPFWSTPKRHYWHLHHVHWVYPLPPQDWYDGWHEWLTCEAFAEFEHDMACINLNPIAVAGARGSTTPAEPLAAAAVAIATLVLLLRIRRYMVAARAPATIDECTAPQPASSSP